MIRLADCERCGKKHWPGSVKAISCTGEKTIAEDKDLAVRGQAESPASFFQKLKDSMTTAWNGALADGRVGTKEYGLGDAWEGVQYEIPDSTANLFTAMNAMDKLDSACGRCNQRLEKLPDHLKSRAEVLCNKCPVTRARFRLIDATLNCRPLLPESLVMQNLLALGEK